MSPFPLFHSLFQTGFIPAHPDNLDFRGERVELRLENFRQIEIHPDLGPPAPREFSTCRNWRFGWTAFPETPRDVELKQ